MIELLVVMGIIVLVTGISWAGFYGLRTSMILRQSGENIKSDLEYSRRAAMLLKRDPGENWVHGIGIDLRGMGGQDDMEYDVFKWISISGTQYQDFSEVQDNFNPENTVVVKGKDDILISKGDLSFQSENDIMFIIFESITGFPHFYNGDGDRIDAANSEITLSRSGRSVKVRTTDEGDILIPTGD